MKKLHFFFLVLFSISLHAQENVEILYQNEDYKFTAKSEIWEFIDANMDVSDQIKIAEYKLTINRNGKNNLAQTFNKFTKMGIDAGANSYTIEDVEAEESQYIVTISLYNLDSEKMQENFSHYEENIIVLFGDLNTNNLDKPKTCKVNGKKVEVLPYHYEKYEVDEGEKFKVSIGGILGTSIQIRGEAHRLARCFALGGGSIMPAGAVIGTGGGGVAISFNTGNIYPMDTCYGLFVMTILDNDQ
ncbi:MAG: hypothetical protein E6767_02385 [Dysgonomonas sp.]|nr:hypothetical protein [Dysgonomonas sp.]